MLVETSTGTGTETSTSVTSDDINSVTPVTLFSFVNLPTVSDEMIWLADAYNWKLYGIDSVSRTISSIIDLPQSSSNDSEKNNFRPWHIAVHPSLKFLAYQTDKYLYLVNIDRKSLHYKETIFATNNGFTRKSKYGGIVFRPDGKCLFVVAKNSSGGNELVPLKVNYTIKSDKTLDWKAAGTNRTPNLTSFLTTNIGLDTERITGLVPANDGYLYVAQKDIKNILRFPMYPSKWSVWVGQVFVKKNDFIYSIDVSPDGNQLVVISKNENLSVYDTRDGMELYKDQKIKVDSNYKNPFKSAFVTCSNASGNNFYDDKSLSIVVTNREASNNKLFAKIFYTLNTTPNTAPTFFGKILRNLTNSIQDKIRAGGVLVTPDNRSVVINDFKKARVYFSNVGLDSADEDYLSTSGKILSYRKIENFDDDSNDNDDNDDDADNEDIKEYSTEIATNKRDVLAFASDNKVQLLDLNTLSKLEDERFEIQKNITSLSFNPLGCTLAGGYANSEKENNTGESNKGHFILHLNDLYKDISDNGGYRKKLVFDDRVPGMLFALEDNTGVNSDTIWNINNNPVDWGEESGTAYDRRDFSLNANWKRLDMIGMPRGGAMVLYGKDDGSSMLEWIGRRNWAQDPQKGKYKLFARWTTGGNYYSKTIPEGTFDFTGAQLDGWYGRIHIIKDQLFPINSVVKSFSAVIGNWSSGEDRWVTFLILEKSGSGFKVIDYSESFSFKSGTTGVTGRHINWLNGGIIKNENCRIGFYNGGSGDSSTNGTQGAFIYKEFSDASYNFFIADYNVSSKTGSINASDGIAYSTVVNLSEVFYESTASNKERNYSLNFNVAIADISTSFPPFYSKKIAISPDCGTLAVLTKNTISSDPEEKVPRVSLYDFNNYNYGAETQIEGMLVDYREQKSYKNYSELNYNWPSEKDDTAFLKVGDNYHLTGESENIIGSFPSLITKHSPLWGYFNIYPANINTSHSNELINKNKRFISYIRPEYNVKNLQAVYSEDLRLFFNNYLIYGSDSYKNTHEKIDDTQKPVLGLNSFTSGLLQIDQTFQGGSGVSLALFLSKINNPSSFLEKENNEKYYTANNDSDWEPINSSQTYILKNQPTFISSYKIQNPTFELDLNFVDMKFSRDKAKPVLYIKGKRNLFVLYNNKLIRLQNNYTNNNSKTFAISTDGQKLIFSNGQILNVFNISIPSDTFFNANSVSAPINTNAEEYLGEIASITLDSTPTLLTAKPFASYKSSSVKGDYKLMCSESYVISSNNSVAVASGGIYIIASDSNDVGLFNPIASYTNVDTSTFEGVLKKESCFSALAVYDDNLYLFGNNIKTDDYLNGRVQSFNPNTKISMCSLDEKIVKGGDQFWTNLCAVEYSGSWGNSGYNNGWKNEFSVSCNGNNDTNSALGGNPEYAFDADSNYGWRSKNNDSEHFLKYTLDKPELKFVVNKLEINNTRVPIGNYGVTDSKYGVKSFEFYGVSDDETSETLLCSGIIPKNTSSYEALLNNPTNTKYKTYKFVLKTNNNHDSKKNIGITEVKMFRTGVKRLTPKGNPKSLDLSNHKAVYDISDGELEVYWSSHKTETKTWSTWGWRGREDHSATYQYPLSDIFSNNITIRIDDNTKVWKCDDSDRWVLFKLPHQETVSILRYCNSKIGRRFVSFKLYGFKDTSINIPSDCNNISDTSKWEEIFHNTCDPLIDTSFVTYEFGNNTPYQYYLVKFESVADSSNFELAGLELYSGTGSGNSSSIEVPNDNYLTSLVDDKLNNIRCDSAAACSTPYGLTITGGQFEKTEDNYLATKTALLYWPHAINKYDGQYYEYGISRSLPEMNNPRMQHSLVWHKGKIYAIGGNNNNISNSYGGDDFAEFLDYNSTKIWDNGHKESDNGYMSWVCYTYFKSFIFDYADGSIDDLKRSNHGACSFGDEIFIFGGQRGTNSFLSDAYAWNPETGVVRKLNNIKDENGNTYTLSPCCAVPFGSICYGNEREHI